MSQTILIEPDADINKLFTINLQTYTGTDIIHRDDAQSTMDLLKILPTVNLIICRNKIGNNHTAKELYQFLESSQLEIPMIILGTEPALSQKTLQITEPLSWEVLIKHSCKLLGITEQEIQKRIKPDHVEISVDYFYDINHTPCDIFIRIKKSPTDFQFVKRLHAQDSFTATDIDKYKEQGLKHFYVTKDYQQYFVTFLTNSIIKKLETKLDITSRLETNDNAFDLVKDHILTAGVTPEISDLAESNIKSMYTLVQEAPSLGDLLKFLFASKISYAYQKAHLVCVIGNHILSKQKGFKEKHLKIFTYLSFFADITLKSNEQMRINSDTELKTSRLSASEKEEVRNHAIDASKVIEDFPHAHQELESILKQQHGTIDGKGFTQDYNENLHPLAKVYMIADAFVKIMLDPSAPKSKREILTILYMQFTEESLQSLIKTLEQQTS